MEDFTIRKSSNFFNTAAMKKTLAFLFIFCSVHAYTQKESIGLKVGIVDVDLVRDYGFSGEVYYEYMISNKLSAGMSLGYISQNSFPDGIHLTELLPRCL